MKRGVGYIARRDVKKSEHLIDTWKLLVPAVGSGRERERSGVRPGLGAIFDCAVTIGVYSVISLLLRVVPRGGRESSIVLREPVF